MSGSGKILIVDDSEQARQLLLHALAVENYEVVAADSGELALKAVILSQPELILLDLRMPEMDGIEVCRRLKASEESRHIPVILLSASLDFKERIEGLRSGAVDFINKPFRREELLARVRVHFELARLQRDLEQRVIARTAELQLANDSLKNELERRRRAEAELLESEQRFRSIADTAPAGIVLFDREGWPVYVSSWLLTFLGGNQVTDNGRLPLDSSTRWFRSVHPEDASRVTEEFAAAVRERRSTQFEYRLRTSDGEYRWLAATVNPRFVNGELAGHIGVNLDITDLRLAQAQAIDGQKLETVGMLAAGIAHNFNTLLGTILAHAELVIDEIPGQTPAHESLSTITAVALRAAEIVSLLVDYADNSGAREADPVDLSSLIRRITPLLQSSVPGTASLAMNLSHRLPAVQANSAQVQQVIMNLVLNASEALEGKPGTISVSTGATRVGGDSQKSPPPGLPEGDYVLLEVVDTGCGMTREVIERIFDPFFSTKFLGRGLGLASVQGIVRRAGGAIDIESSPGSGSRFTVWLPCWDIQPD